ncbi:MAG: nicotinate-nucleotide--dimethylbenzimidazole phosphoribosyltransferase [Clostridiaceae bacterium]|jgi:nicotinate-nucleotide--dimethylbenzimidazole phosphoribosyltransferase|nr:nicotinate-nucleotide--dimethylbenzimidazole phosphoribosyltransferase [Clostridiaceae bacterium]
MTKKEKDLGNYIAGITGIDHAAADAAGKRLDGLVKPPGSLGRLEDIAARLAGITGQVCNTMDRRCVIIMCSDNGVVEEGVASAPQSVTYAQTINFTRGITGVAVLAKCFNADLMVVDVGINADISHPGIISRKIRKGTSNLAKQPAMTRDEAVSAMLTGIEMAGEARRKGYKIIGVGEMGIGNTTTSSAVLCALTGIDAGLAVGKGAGLSNEGFEKKKQIIMDAIKMHKPDPNDAIDVISKVGGFDIAAMTGVFLGAAYYKLPVVIDGFISAVAALAAARLAGLAAEYMIPSHASYEPGYIFAARELGLEPVLMLDMRLGEGSGCPIMFMVIDAACAILRDMGTFAEAGIDDEYLENIKGEECFSTENNSTENNFTVNKSTGNSSTENE